MPQHRTRLGGQHHTAQRRPGPGMIHVPAQMLARDTPAKRRAVKPEHRLEMPSHEIRQRRPARHIRRREPVKPCGHLGQQPRPALRAAPDHHARRPRPRLRHAGSRGIHDVAIGDDRNPDRLGHVPDRLPIGAPLVELTARAAVNGDHGDPRRLGPPRDIRCVQAVMIPAEPGLERHRHIHRADNRLDQPQRVIRRAHQRGARRAVAARARHLLGGAAHVDVDNPRAPVRDHARGLGDPVRLAAGKLHHGVLRPKAQLGLFARPRPGLHHFLTGDHLADHQPRTELRHERSKGQVSDSRHRGEDHGRR